MSESNGLNKKDLIEIRGMYPDDWNFILATWLKGLRYGNDWFGMVDPSVYYEAYQKVIERILQSPGTDVRVACLKDSPDVILGYAVIRDSTLDWVFVKSRWRTIGIARSLVPENINTVSHLTEIAKSLLKKHPDIKFNPFR